MPGNASRDRVTQWEPAAVRGWISVAIVAAGGLLGAAATYWATNTVAAVERATTSVKLESVDKKIDQLGTKLDRLHDRIDNIGARVLVLEQPKKRGRK